VDARILVRDLCARGGCDDEGGVRSNLTRHEMLMSITRGLRSATIARRDSETLDLAFLIIADWLWRSVAFSPRQRRDSPLSERGPQLIGRYSRCSPGILLRHAI